MTESDEALWTRWLAVGKLLSRDPTAEVQCPVCGDSTIVVTDVPSSADPERFERQMRCTNCGASNSLLMTRSGDKPAQESKARVNAGPKSDTSAG